MTLDCTTCGACCVWETPMFAGCTAADVARLGGRALVLETPEGRAMATEPAVGGHRCRALVGFVGAQVACAVYDARPDSCRGFEVGGPDCRRSRARAGMEE